MSDDTDSEEVISRVGRIPFKWYDNFNHMGYDVNAQKIQKLKQDSAIDDFINKSENKDWWRTIRDELNQKDVILTDQQLQVLQRIRTGKFADKQIANNDYSVEFDWNEGMFPLSAAPKSKRSFLPSKNERIMINKLVQAIKLGRINLEKKQEQDDILQDVWENEDIQDKRSLPPITAPKLALPNHSESYNPSAEYLMDENEQKNYMDLESEDRPNNYIPKKHDNLRQVEQYQKLINERFDRCLDLYLCPRLKKKRLNMTTDQLIPKLPKPQELRPFPTQQTIIYEAHKDQINGLSVDKQGQFIASCDNSGLFVIFEVKTSRVQQKIKFQIKCQSIDWNQNGLILLASGNQIYILQPQCLRINFDFQQIQKNYKKNDNLDWHFYEPTSDEYLKGIRIKIDCQENEIDQVSWHQKGDYFSSLSQKAEKRNEQVYVHSLQKAESQKLFQKSKGNIQKVLFHNKKPFLFLVTQKNTYIYNLQQQAMSKKLVSGAQVNSCIALHPQGDNLLVGTHDRRLCWFDLDLSNKPYKTFRYHERSVRNVSFHTKYPLFASCSEDGSIHIFHQTVYNDLMQNALIVPLKILKSSEQSILDIQFHPTQPWIFSAQQDHKLILWT